MAIPAAAAALAAGARAALPGVAKNMAMNSVIGRVSNFASGMGDAQRETNLSGGGGMINTHNTPLPGTDTDAGSSYVGY